MNILTIAMFGLLVVLSLNPDSRKQTDKVTLAASTQQLSQQVAYSGIETVIYQATSHLKEKHLQ